MAQKSRKLSVIRAFIAIDLPVEVHECLEQVSFYLKRKLEDIPVRWVAVPNIHLTLKFLGDVSLSNLEMLEKCLVSETANYRPMTISVGGIGAYPRIRRPRVIWVGVEAPAELNALQRAIDVGTSRVGYSRDKRPFSAHLTLGRVSRNATPRDVGKIGDVLSDYKVGFLGVARVREVHLFRSDLKPTGAVYTRMFSAPLKE
jgi:2'-5' RNA ligase